MVRAFGIALSFTSLCAIASASDDTICSLKFSKFARDVRNPQIQIWELREANRTESVNRLERATRNLLQNGKADPIGNQAIDAPVILELEGGIRGVWKRLSSRTRREVVAYKFDRMIDADFVPVTVYRRYSETPGTIQLFVRGTDEASFVNEPRTLRLFDFLMAHDDRHGGNILSHHGRAIAIDNEGTFFVHDAYAVSGAPDFPKILEEKLKLATTSSAQEKVRLANEISTMLISEKSLLKLRTTSEREWRAGLPELNENEILAFLARKNRAVTIIDRAERELGVSIYPGGRFSGLDRLRWREGRAALRHYDPRSPEMEVLVDRATQLIDREDIFGRPLEPGEVHEVQETLKLIRLDR